ncbi:hypothetical protein AB9K35_07720 [Leisingera sp. XS_AS12]|uniref:hypothetical protein n=1 Tax=Leisingera sp. XS_AS12 TaxID=3241294 RepID=UPI0035130626
MAKMLTVNQKAVLQKLSGVSEGLCSRDFAEIATVQHGRWEWAQPILKALEARGFVQRVGRKTAKGQAWQITAAGRAAASAEIPARPVSGKLSMTMENEIVATGRSQAKGVPYTCCTRRSTHQALKARGLVTIVQRSDSWREIRLTQAGVEAFQTLTGEPLKIPVEIDA